MDSVQLRIAFILKGVSFYDILAIIDLGFFANQVFYFLMTILSPDQGIAGKAANICHADFKVIFNISLWVSSVGIVYIHNVRFASFHTALEYFLEKLSSSGIPFFNLMHELVSNENAMVNI